MQDMEFRKDLSELRERIHSGEVTEGRNELMRLSATERIRERLLEIFLDLVEVSVALGEREEAKSFLQEARRQIEGEAPERYEFYRAFLSPLGRRRTGREDRTPLDGFVAQNPGCEEYYLVRGIYFLESEAYDHAQADLERANALSPNDVFVLSALGEVMMNLGDKARAISLNEEALGRCANLRRSLINLAILYYGDGRNEEAYRLFCCLLAVDPMNWFAWTCLGDMALSERGKTFQSLLYYSAAIVAGTTIPHTYLQMAKTLCFLGRPERALYVVKLLEPDVRKWPKECQAVIRYIQIARDIARRPGGYDDRESFDRLVKRLGARHDEITVTLVRLLTRCASVNYSKSVTEIYASHMAVFSQMAQFMRLCDSRSIYEEEIVFIGLLTRYMIWNGFLFEARAMLYLMGRSPDPHLSDMYDMYVNELYKYSQMSENAGVRLSLFHEHVFHSEDLDDVYNYLTDKGIKDFPPKWREVLSSFMRPPMPSDIELNLLGSVFDPLMKEIERLSGKVGDSEQEGAFWRACQEYCLWQESKKAGHRGRKGRSEGEYERALPGEWASLFESFKRICENDQRLKDTVQQKHSRWRSLGELIDRAHRAHGIESLRVFQCTAANDDSQVQCATPISEALNGYEPMPFAVDGTAFKRIWNESSTSSVKELNAGTAEEVLESVLRGYIFDIERLRTNGTVKVEDSNVAQRKNKTFYHRAHCLWSQLHGITPISKRPFIEEMAGGRTADENSVLTEDLKNLSEATNFIMHWLTSGSPVFKRMMGAALTGKLSGKSWKLPEQMPVLYPMSCRRQAPPQLPKGTEPLRRYVSSGLLTRVALTEQFFNYGVYVCREWRKTRDEKLLEVFFEDEGALPFVPYSRGSSMEAGESHDQMRGYDYDPHLMRECSTIFGSKLIETPAELGESIDKAYRDIVEKESIPRIKDYEGFNTGYPPHMFLFQFKYWAEYKAQCLYGELVRCEAKLRHWNSADRFVLEWKINDVIRQYPFLSRLYLLLVKLYIKSGETDKATQAFLAGLDWEDKLYSGVGWSAVCDEDGREGGIEPVSSSNEFEESQLLIWSERYVFGENEESMFHYRPYDSAFKMRRMSLPDIRAGLMYPVIYCDNGGAYEFYRLFKKFIVQDHPVKEAWLKAIAENDVYSLEDFFRFVMIELEDPHYFPFRRQLGDLYYQLYPQVNPGALAKFFCDNMQPVNALPYAALSHFMGSEQDDGNAFSPGALTLGCLLYDMGYMEAAVEYLEEAIKSLQPMAFLTLGCAYIELDRNKEALRALERGVEIDPYCDRFYYNMSLAYFALDKIDKAEESAKKGIDLASYPVDLRLQLMRVYVKREKYTEALPLAQYVSSEDPDMFAQAIVHPEFSQFRRLSAVRKIVVELGLDAKICDDD